jgi:hypothetical protein
VTHISHKDVFLSHATADKDNYVRPFAKELDRRSISYWLDEAEVLWGDKISTKINEGLKLSDFVVVFLSDGFVGRNWTEAELASALNRENSEGRTVVLPVIIGEAKELLANYPLLRDKSYLRWDIGVSAIADELQRLTSRRWSKLELDHFIVSKVDLEQFPKQEKDIWGDGYRLLAKRIQFDEGYYFFWNKEQKVVEKYWIDAVRSYGKEPITEEDIEFLRSIVVKCTKRAS